MNYLDQEASQILLATWKPNAEHPLSLVQTEVENVFLGLTPTFAARTITIDYRDPSQEYLEKGSPQFYYIEGKNRFSKRTEQLNRAGGKPLPTQQLGSLPESVTHIVLADLFTPDTTAENRDYTYFAVSLEKYRERGLEFARYMAAIRDMYQGDSTEAKKILSELTAKYQRARRDHNGVSRREIEQALSELAAALPQTDNETTA